MGRRNKKPAEPPPPPRTPWWQVWLLCAVLAVGTALLYARTSRHELLESWDDGVFIISNPVLLDPAGLKAIWSTLEMPDSYPNYPLVFTTYWIEAQIAGINVPRVGEAMTGVSLFHITNLVLHSICVVLVFLVGRHLGFGTWGAWFVGLLFAVHPIQVESVAWVTERKNVLSGMFYLATFLCYRKFREKERAGLYAATLGLFVLGLLSKTAVVTLPASLWLADVLIDRRKVLPSFAWVVPMLVLGGAAALATLWIEQEDTKRSMDLVLRPLLMSGTGWYYVYKLVVPWNYLAVYPRWEVTGANVGLWLCLIGWVAVGAGAFFFRKRLDGRVLWGVGHFWVTILPISGMVHYGYLAHTYVADRFAYLAGIGVFVIVAAGLEILIRKIGSPRRRKGLLAGAGLATAGLGAVSYVQIGYWGDNMSLWRHTLAHNPESYDAHFNLGHAQNDLFLSLNPDQSKEPRRPDLEATAIEHYEKTIRIRPTFSKAHNNLANIYLRRGDRAMIEPKDVDLFGREYAMALKHFDSAIRAKPDYPKALNNRAFALAKSGRMDEAIEGFQRAIEIKPDYAKAYVNLVFFLNRAGRSDEVLGWLERGFSHIRTDSALTFSLALEYRRRGRLDAALEKAELALRLATARRETNRTKSSQRLIDQIKQMRESPAS